MNEQWLAVYIDTLVNASPIKLLVIINQYNFVLPGLLIWFSYSACYVISLPSLIEPRAKLTGLNGSKRNFISLRRQLYRFSGHAIILRG